ncbi:hypothetical protein AJ79_01999 [Helicocarpus griseus UAMH5409]|uniref:Mid2 domain-containing protein n=1 Tax=Helicocarpus griseus UAMH5409 TaxID=1447875 RepID=A0A2B7Y4E6_9EURO|nr:hypothetical protein AJ79_01999 [Helicocarpus griseus UAMH5409]
MTPSPSLLRETSTALPTTPITSLSTMMIRRTDDLVLRQLGSGPEIIADPCRWPTEQFTVADSSHHTMVYLQISCKNSKGPNCCPVDSDTGTPHSSCPLGYTSIADNACCPQGFSVYTALLGTQTPCYSQHAAPTSPPDAIADSELTAINNAVFAPKYSLLPLATTRPSTASTSSTSLIPSSIVTSPPQTSPSLSTFATSLASSRPMEPSKPSEIAPPNPLSFHKKGLDKKELAGVVIGSVFGAALLFGLALLFLLRWKRRRDMATLTVDDLIRQPTKEASTNELVPSTKSQEVPIFMQPRDESWTTGTIRSVPFTHSNSQYLDTNSSTEVVPTIRSIEPQELPGNTFINEYHPAYRNDPGSWRS